MVATDFLVTPELTALAEQAKQNGLGNGVDFYIRGVPFTGPLGPNLVGLSFDGNEYCVELRGADRTRNLLRTGDFAAARDRFLAEAQQVAAGYQPRREHRPDPVPAPAKSESRVGTVLMAIGLGFVFGVLILPLLVVLLVVAVASGSYGSGSDKDGKKSKRPWRGDWDQKIGLGIGTMLGLVVLAGGLYAVFGR